MQPYQEATESELGYRGFPAKAASVAVPLAKLGKATSMLKRIAPFLSPYLPDDIAKKGLEKVDPRLGKFINMAGELGHDFGQIRTFIGDKLTESQPQNIAQQASNIIKQYSPELYNFMESKIKGGMTPEQAGALAQLEKKGGFKNIIKKIEKDHKSPWSTIIANVFGMGDMTQQQAQPAQTQPNPVMVQQQQGMGPGAQSLMAMLQKINQRLGA